MELFQMIQAIIGLLLIICIFIMGANIGQILKILKKMNDPKAIDYSSHYNQGELNEYLGKKIEALENYKTSLYYMNVLHSSAPKLAKKKNEISNKAVLEAKIKQLEGFS